MKQLFERLDRYGTGWILSFRVGVTNNIVMVLEYLDPATIKMHQEQFMLGRKDVQHVIDGDYGEAFHIMDTLHKRILAKIK